MNFDDSKILNNIVELFSVDTSLIDVEDLDSEYMSMSLYSVVKSFSHGIEALYVCAMKMHFPDLGRQDFSKLLEFDNFDIDLEGFKSLVSDFSGIDAVISDVKSCKGLFNFHKDWECIIIYETTDKYGVAIIERSD